jgi:TPR repeat protein
MEGGILQEVLWKGLLTIPCPVGNITPQDYKEALTWYMASAEQGVAAAQYNLGVSYGNGDGTPQDYKSAHMWLNLAAARGHEDAKTNRDIIAGRMTPADISTAQQMASERMKEHP